MNEFPNQMWHEAATIDDVYYCYRLLLRREPDAAGLKFWEDRLTREAFTFSKLAAYFCQSQEYLTSKEARGLKLVSFDDFELYVYEHDWDIGEQMLETGRYEPYVSSFLREQLKPGFTFVDVGANAGYFTVLAAKQVGSAGRTIAVECNPRNSELIFLNLRRNEISNGVVYPFAVSDEPKLLSLSVGFSNGAVDELRNGVEGMIVQAVTLDSLLQNEPRVDVIKMDVEGSEAKAWRGMTRIIKHHRPMIILEFFPALLEEHSGTTGSNFLDEIFAHGYSATIFEDEAEPNTEADDPLKTATSTAEVMEIWKRRCETAGDPSQAYLNLALKLPELSRWQRITRRLLPG